MDLVKIILKEHSKKQRDLIVSYIDNNPKRFAELVDVFLKGPYRVTQRASWPLSYCIELNPNLIKPHLRTLFKAAQQPHAHDAVKRNIVRAMQFVKMPKTYHAKAIELCMQFLQDGKEPVAIRVFAMTVLANLAKEIPELKNELIPVIEDMMPFGSAGFVSRGSKILKVLKAES